MKKFTPKLDTLPRAQRDLWPELRPLASHGFVLYGGTAVALRLGHRQSVDFDFFSFFPLNLAGLNEALPILGKCQVIQSPPATPNTLTVLTPEKVILSFFGNITFGQVEEPQFATDGVLCAASLIDLMATKLKVIFERSQAKDYQDIAAMLRAGVPMGDGLAAAEKMFPPQFSPAVALRALTYFEDGDLGLLAESDRQTLAAAASAVRQLPPVILSQGPRPPERI